MNRDSGRRGTLARALIAGTFVCMFAAAGTAPAQDEAAAPAAAASGAPPAETTTQSRRDRRHSTRADAAPAQEQTATAAPAAKVEAGSEAAATAQPEEPPIVCKNFKPLGTRMAKRVCGTPEQWAAFEKKTTDAASDDLRSVRSTGGVIATTPGTAAGP